jgi:hypothetical protein
MKKVEIVSELKRSTLVEEMSWRLKSRVLWLKEGDKCTLWLILTKERISLTHCLLIVLFLPNQAEINEHIVRFYQKLYTKQIVRGY